MAENKIIPWAQTGTANVLSDDAYAADVAKWGLYGDGVKTGQASSQQANKTWRQATAPGSGLSQFLVDNLSVDVTDADTPATFSNRIANAVLKLAQVSPFNHPWATTTGGYRKYAIVSDSSGNFWVSTSDQNVTVPGANGAKWQSLFSGCLQLGLEATQIVTGPVRFTNQLSVPDIGAWNTSEAVPASLLLNTLNGLIPTAILTSQTVTKPSWASRALISCIGGGGGGGGCWATSAKYAVGGGGGGAGGYGVGIYSFGSNTQVQFIIGSGGGGGGNTSTPGGNGGATYAQIGGVTVLLANGGGGAGMTSAQGGARGGGGTVTGANILSANGADGSDCSYFSNQWWGLGNGASGPFGGGAGAGSVGTSGMATSGHAMGSGGAGAYDSSLSGKPFSGGAGFQGGAFIQFLP